MLDAENWKIVFEVYAGRPIAALVLAQQLYQVRESLQRGPKGRRDAIAELDLAIETLYPHTDFHRLGHESYRRTVEGTITSEQEKLLNKLGVTL